MIPDLIGKTVEIIRQNYALMLWTDDNWQIDLAGHTVLWHGDDDPRTIDTTVYRQELSEMVKPLLGAEISALTVSPDGDLSITVGGIHVNTSAGDDHEAWQISGPKGEKVVCMPGGELAIWGPRTT